MNHVPFRLVIVGAGAISRIAHVPAAIASPHVSLVGLIDPNREQAQSVCELYGINPEIAADVSQLSASFDGAVVATPNDLHASVARSLIEQNIPVLIEKPMANDWQSAQEIVSLGRAKDLTVAVGYQMRHSAAGQALKRVIETNQFGKTKRFACQHGSRGGWSPVSGYNLDKQRAGGGVLMTTGTHFLDRVLWLWGVPTRVEFQDNGYQGPESHCIARFDYAGSGEPLRGSAFFSKLVGLPESTVVETEQGYLVMGGDTAVTFRPHGNTDIEYEIKKRGEREDPRVLYQRQLEDFAQACTSGRPPCVDAAVGAQSVKLVNDLYAARQPLRADHYGAGQQSRESIHHG